METKIRDRKCSGYYFTKELKALRATQNEKGLRCKYIETIKSRTKFSLDAKTINCQSILRHSKHAQKY